MPVLASAADAEARAAALVALHARAAAAAAAESLDAKERGAADECLAMAARALLAAWRLEGCPRSQRRLLQVLTAFHGLHRAAGHVSSCKVYPSRAAWSSSRSLAGTGTALQRMWHLFILIYKRGSTTQKQLQGDSSTMCYLAARKASTCRGRLGFCHRRWRCWRRGRWLAQSARRCAWRLRRCTACWARLRLLRGSVPPCTSNTSSWTPSLVGCPVCAQAHHACQSCLRHACARTLALSGQHLFAGHLLLPALLAAPCEAQRAELLHATQVLRSNHLREAGTSLLAAFQWGHYSKVNAWQ